jgi:hypothetical protein
MLLLLFLSYHSLNMYILDHQITVGRCKQIKEFVNWPTCSIFHLLNSYDSEPIKECGYRTFFLCVNGALQKKVKITHIVSVKQNTYSSH